MKRTLTIFYSWQTDLPNSTNRQAIRSALLDVSSKIEEKFPDYKMLIDEATRDESGSPDISSSILAKIKKCDVYVCDISIINSASDGNFRRTPNPNVLFELGYAVALIGWPRILLMFNECYGNIESDVPFDIRKHRISTFRLSVDDKRKKEVKNELSQLLRDALFTVIEKNPSKQYLLDQKSPEGIRKERDSNTLDYILGQVQFTVIDEMFASLPYRMESKYLFYWEVFDSIVGNSLFHIYDKEVNDLIFAIYTEWEKCVKHGVHYQSCGSSKSLLFIVNDVTGMNFCQKSAYDEIESAKTKLRDLLRNFYSVIRARFVELDVENLDGHAFAEYLAYLSRTEKKESNLLQKGLV